MEELCPARGEAGLVPRVEKTNCLYTPDIYIYIYIRIYMSISGGSSRFREVEDAVGALNSLLPSRNSHCMRSLLE